MWTSEAMEKLGKAYFLRNKAWYTGTDPDGPEAEADDCPMGYKLTDKAPEEAVVSYNHCFDISPDGKHIPCRLDFLYRHDPAVVHLILIVLIQVIHPLHIRIRHDVLCPLRCIDIRSVDQADFTFVRCFLMVIHV